MGNYGYSAGKVADLVPLEHPPARGKGWVSKMGADTLKGNSDDECCDRTGLVNGGGDSKLGVSENSGVSPQIIYF